MSKRKCYLCDYKFDKNKHISLHHFPNQHQQNRKQWLEVCGLNKTDNVSQVFVCTRHFHPHHYSVANKKIKLLSVAVPSKVILSPEAEVGKICSLPPKKNSTDITYDNHSIVQSDEIIQPCIQSDNLESSIVLDHVENICEDINNDKENREMLTINNVIADNNTAALSKSQCYNGFEELTPKKGRRVLQPRYVSEIELSDFATPRKAKMTLNFVKSVDVKKSKTIAQLKAANRKQAKRIANMKQMLSHLQKKEVILEGPKNTQ